ncbi:MAG: hypothetical protein A2293_15360 [Elusimicrobia bacterium RIFOXYB2_FULL_49_7]|nr:MAG: hypothetical protein A2293_15360 [Elusimicrobia bacterium RIFOXYB2_FULL_49_7]
MAQKKNRNDDNQLDLFELYKPDSNHKKVRELGQAINTNLNASQLTEAKAAARSQEQLLKKMITEKKEKRR